MRQKALILHLGSALLWGLHSSPHRCLDNKEERERSRAAGAARAQHLWASRRAGSTAPALVLREEKAKAHLPQHSSLPRRCSQYRPARLGTDQATSYSISWLLWPPRLLGVASDGTDAARLETSPRHRRAAQHALPMGLPWLASLQRPTGSRRLKPNSGCSSRKIKGWGRAGSARPSWCQGGDTHPLTRTLSTGTWGNTPANGTTGTVGRGGSRGKTPADFQECFAQANSGFRL